MQSRSYMEMISGYNGSLTLTPAAYTAGGGLPPFKSFRADDGVTISVLKATPDHAGGVAGSDALTEHITGGGATALKQFQLKICRQDLFTDITFAGGNIEIYF